MTTEIQTEEGYRVALARLEELFDIPDDSPDLPELANLMDLVQAYEDIHYPIGQDIDIKASVAA